MHFSNKRKDSLLTEN